MPARKSTSTDTRPPGEQFIANLPGIGQGMLDTLRALAAPNRMAFDTSSMLGQTPGAFVPSNDADTVFLNPQSLRQMRHPEGIATLLGHEAIGHGIMGSRHRVGASPFDSFETLLGRSFVRLSGRDPQLPMFNGAQEMQAHSILREMMNRILSSDTQK